jgi:hypothetical protein
MRCSGCDRTVDWFKLKVLGWITQPISDRTVTIEMRECPHCQKAQGLEVALVRSSVGGPFVVTTPSPEFYR